MKWLYKISLLCIMLAVGHIAAAQSFSAPGTGRLRGEEDPAQQSRGNRYSHSLGVFPLAIFDTAGNFDAGRSGTRSLYGGLIAYDFSIFNNRSKNRFDIGGWYWRGSSEDLYEVHARIVGSSGLGFQFGYLNTTQGFALRQSTVGNQNIETGANAYTVFALYELSPQTLGLNWRRANWSVQFGAGTFINTTPRFREENGNQILSRASTANFTFFVSGALQLHGNLYLLLTDWIVRDRDQNYNRITAGIGLNF